MTILSQNTSDTNTERSFAALRAAYPAWEDVMGAAEGDLVDVLRSGGLANQKAPRHPGGAADAGRRAARLRPAVAGRRARRRRRRSG